MNRERTIAAAALIITTLLWALPAIAIRYLSDHFDGFTQNMYRYGISAVLVFGISLARRRNVFHMGRRNLLRMLGPAIPNIGFQVIWVAALYIVYPGFAVVMQRTWVLFSILLAVILFPEERKVVKQGKFLLGAALSLCGVFGVLLFKGSGLAVQFDTGLFLILAGAVGWAMYSIQIRRAVAYVNAVDAFVVVSIYTAVAMIILGFVFGNPGRIFEVGTFINVVLFGSGILCIAIGHTTYYVAIQGLGVAICSTFVLLSCFITVFLSYLIFEEAMNVWQIASGAVLVLGSLLIVWAGKEAEHSGPHTVACS